MVIKDGAKMSKSKGNVVSPEEMVDTLRRGHGPRVCLVRRASGKRHGLDTKRARKERSFLGRVSAS